MDEIGYRPEVIAQDANFYDQIWLDAAGAVGRRRVRADGLQPVRGGRPEPGHPAVPRPRRGHRRQGRPLGTQSLSAWLLFAQAARDCDLDNNLTRTCVLETAPSVDGLDGRRAPRPDQPRAPTSRRQCTLVLQVQDGAFTRYAPDEGYDCGEDSDQPSWSTSTSEGDRPRSDDPSGFCLDGPSPGGGPSSRGARHPTPAGGSMTVRRLFVLLAVARPRGRGLQQRSGRGRVRRGGDEQRRSDDDRPPRVAAPATSAT